MFHVEVFFHIQFGLVIFWSLLKLIIVLFESVPREVTCFPQDIKILGWCPAGPLLPNGEKVLATLLVMFSQ